MKLILLALSVLTLNSSAQASLVPDITVDGLKAKAIIKALTTAGAKQFHTIEYSVVNVSDISIHYTPQGFVWSQGQLTDEIATGTGSAVVLHPIVGVSHEIFAALVDAGVPVINEEAPIESSLIKAKSVSCVQGYNVVTHTVGAQCEIIL